MEEKKVHKPTIQQIAHALGYSAVNVQHLLERNDDSAALTARLRASTTHENDLKIIKETVPGTAVRIEAIKQALDRCVTKLHYKQLFAAIGKDSIQRSAVVRQMLELGWVEDQERK